MHETAGRRAGATRSSGRGCAQIDVSSGLIVRAGGALCGILGYSEQELAQKRLPDLAPPEDRTGSLAAWRALLEGGTDERAFELRCLHKDGSVRKLHVTGFLVHDIREPPSCAVVFVEDITPGERAEAPEVAAGCALDTTAFQQTEETFRRSAWLFRAIGRSIDYGVWVSDRDGRNVYASEAFLRMAGMTQEQCWEHGWIDALHPDDRHKVAIFERCVRTGEPFEEELRYLGEGGAVHPVLNRGVPVRDERGEICCWVGLCLDISRHKRAEEALRESERRLRAALDEARRSLAERERLEDELRRRERQLASLMEHSPDAIFRIDLGLRCTFMSPTSTVVTGFPPEHYLGKTPRECGFSAEVCEASETACREAQRTRRPQRAELSLGERRYRIRLIPELGPDGAVESFMGIAEDITAERHAEEERWKLLESERAARDEAERVSRVKDDFVATLSHELRSPINAILGWARILQSRQGHAPDAHVLARGLEVIERNARIEADMVSELLDMSRIISGKLRLDVQEADLPAIIQGAIESIQLAAEAKEITVASAIALGPTSLRGDPARLQQVVWNLLTNAVKFTPAGGRVDVTLRRARAHAELTVSDTGVGVGAQFLPHVFERFRQADASSARKYGGLGIGLSIVKHLVELHGGTVAVASEGEGRGTTFTVRLPLAGVSQEAPGAAPSKGAARAAVLLDDAGAELTGVRVLVVDDQADAREVAQRVLAECAATVTTVASAAEALAALERERPDVLVSDLGMPVEDGFQLIRKVRALGAERGGATPAVALSALARAEDRARALGAGYQAHIAKPLDPAELVGVVGTLARGRDG
ncbi:histidine kinase [Sorangium cellulosum]|uniref:histidine kinase n=1 Tax=Sorangium cellulosum TaxID=56 RepID=A0A4P2Q3K2_SORCE|nr:hybrid sensor histidine kinase/response regulator [Sorangium cellulosum]AUX23578.1 histidine kinase [Sorangium cellulosum]